ncbi:unnamed protein product [Callosobruchus maculatus]|uniref:BTB domain-containing protein n=1 Tax=Callosobruchus maculatus TaxID=64391 RepID=A0A653CK30_CALMS|nr:unnamed protein product [Callosobruchus maculatus]
MKRKIRICTEDHLRNLEKTFKSLLQNDVLTDCTLWCKNGSVRVHKLVLAAVSPHFRKIFMESDQNSSVYMYGIAIEQLQYLIELIYKGFIDVPGKNFNSVYDLVESLEITGLIVDTFKNKEKEKYRRSSTHASEENTVENKSEKKESSAPVTGQSQNAHTEGHSGTETQSAIEVIESSEDTTENEAAEPLKAEEDDDSCGAAADGADQDDAAKSLTPWQKMERKYSCLECPRRFKRASHLARHQLVHSGEKPHECDLCHKMFSRHDKLKTHIKKMHTPKDESLPAEALYAIDHVQILTGDPTNDEQRSFRSNSIGSTTSMSDEDDSEYGPTYEPARRCGRPRKPIVPFTISGEPPGKKRRGRPPKNPGLFPEVKKEKKKRGRPRIHPKVEKGIRPRGRPRVKPLVTGPTPAPPQNPENHTIEVVPSDNLRYLTAPTSTSEANNDVMIIEPEIEIQEGGMTADDRKNFLQNIGLLQNSPFGTIGECTITMAPN